jgi:hypothetical protein
VSGGLRFGDGGGQQCRKWGKEEGGSEEDSRGESASALGRPAVLMLVVVTPSVVRCGEGCRRVIGSLRGGGGAR